MKKPNFFIVGAPRCGTSSMYVYLKQHPDIFMPDIKEPRYFGRDLNTVDPRISKEEYLSLFTAAKGEKKLGEATPSYIYSKTAALEIKEFNDEADIIIMLRNPVDMMYSLHSKCVTHGIENICDFKLALEAEEERKKGLHIPKNCAEPRLLFYRERANYVKQIKRYLNVFGHEKVHIIIFDRLIEEPDKVYKKTLSFLGVENNFVPSSFGPVNKNVETRSSLFRDGIQEILQYPFIRSIKSILPMSMRRSFREKLHKLNTKPAPRQPMDQKLRHSLQREFFPEVKRLSELLRRDLTDWCRKD